MQIFKSEYHNPSFFYAFCMATLLLAGLLPGTAREVQAAENQAIRILEEIPVQHGGRIKPFQSFAQEAALYVTGKSRFRGIKPARLIWEWMALPEQWYTTPLIPVGYHALQKEFGLMLSDGRLSPEIALNHQPFLEKVRDAAEKRERKDSLSELEKKRLEVYEKAAFFRHIGEGGVPGWIAHPHEPRAGWLPLQSLIAEDGRRIISQFYPEDRVEAMSRSLSALTEQFRHTEKSVSAEAAGQFAAGIEDLHASRHVLLDKAVIFKEVFYNRLDPFRRAWILYGLSFLVSLGYAFSAGKTGAGLGRRLAEAAGLACFLGGFFLHAYGFYLRCMIAGRPPVTNMYESMIWVSWSVAFFALIFYAVYRTLFVRNTAALVAAFALILAEAFPVALNPAISPLVPVLRSNLWLTVHVLTITLSYGAFALAWGLGHGVLYSFAFHRSDYETQGRLSQYLYRTIQIGVVLLAAGTILGGVWANYSWGRFWGWDPKETWALIALLGYLAVLHGRFAGWLGHFGVAAGSIIAFLGILMAWYGVNFVLAAGLHSYGFGGGGLGYVLTAVFADLAVVGALAYIAKRSKQRAVAI